ncbi:redoxin domain-containing protein [Novipirellula galeiformis]|nr:redoxin domain-containing protein [Novipirellula galeiformis]
MPSPVKADATLGIGSPAPAIDVEHWLQDGKGFFKPVTKFEKGKVYVIEFWATWCGPCVMSMPHLAELQNQFRGQNVQIISVSDEEVEEVKEFLARENEELKQTFEQITSAYCLTTDPDRSVYKDYMDAAKQQGIPTSFIVGKDAHVEWIGHPMEMEEPLQKVVNDAWDREAFKKAMEAKQQLEAAIEQISKLAGAGKFDDAIKLVEKQITLTDDPSLIGNLKDFRASLMLSAGHVTDEVVQYYRERLADMKGNWMSLGQFGYSLTAVVQQGGKVGPLAAEAVAALAPIADKADPEAQPLVYHILAQLSKVDNKLDEAIAFQQKSVELSDDRQKKRMQLFLDELTPDKESENDEK